MFQFPLDDKHRCLSDWTHSNPYIFPSFPFVRPLVHVCSVKTVGPLDRASPYILHRFRSVSPHHWQWPAPMGSWRVPPFLRALLYVSRDRYTLLHQTWLPHLCLHQLMFQECRATLACLCRTSGWFYLLQLISADSWHFAQPLFYTGAQNYETTSDSKPTIWHGLSN